MVLWYLAQVMLNRALPLRLHFSGIVLFVWISLRDSDVSTKN